MKTTSDTYLRASSPSEKIGLHLPAEGVTTKLLKEMMQPLPVPRATRLVVIGCGVKIHFPWGTRLPCLRECGALDKRDA